MLLTFSTFFIVVYSQQCYVRFTTMYTNSMHVIASVQDIMMWLSINFPGNQVLRTRLLIIQCFT